MFKFLLAINLICLIVCQEQQKPLPSPSFGRVFKAKNFDNSFSACTNPASYGFVQRAGTTKYYSIADIQMNWIDAENYCQSFGAHLPVATSASDINFFRCKKFFFHKFKKISQFMIRNFYLDFFFKLRVSWRKIYESIV